MIEGNKKIGNEIGRLGEEISCLFLENKGFKILERNYQKKWGEIDIIARKNGSLHFFEVKSVSRKIKKDISSFKDNIGFRAEDNLHKWKQNRLKRAIQTFLVDRKVSPETKWSFGLLVVKLDLDNKLSSVKMLKDIIL